MERSTDSPTVPFVHSNLTVPILSPMSRASRDHENGMWFVTLDGLFRVKDGRSTRYSTDDGLLSNRMRTSVLGPDGTIWIGSTHGLTTYRHGAFTFVRPRHERFHSRRERHGARIAKAASGPDRGPTGSSHLWRGQFTTYTVPRRPPGRLRLCGDRRQARHGVGRHGGGSRQISEWSHPRSAKKTGFRSE